MDDWEFKTVTIDGTNYVLNLDPAMTQIIRTSITSGIEAMGRVENGDDN